VVQHTSETPLDQLSHVKRCMKKNREAETRNINHRQWTLLITAAAARHQFCGIRCRSISIHCGMPSVAAAAAAAAERYRSVGMPNCWYSSCKYYIHIRETDER